MRERGWIERIARGDPPDRTCLRTPTIHGSHSRTAEDGAAGTCLAYPGDMSLEHVRPARTPAFKLALVAIASVLAACGTSPAPGPAAPQRTPVTQDDRMAWWREARFGMFLHWGLYAIPAGKWRDRDDHGANGSFNSGVLVHQNWSPNGLGLVPSGARHNREIVAAKRRS